MHCRLATNPRFYEIQGPLERRMSSMIGDAKGASSRHVFVTGGTGYIGRSCVASKRHRMASGPCPFRRSVAPESFLVIIRAMRRLINYFLRGLVLVAPLAITIYVCWIVFVRIDGWLALSGAR